MVYYARDEAGKISDKVLSKYGKIQLGQLQGVTIQSIGKVTLTVKGNELINPSGEVVKIITSDKTISNIMSKII